MRKIVRVTDETATNSNGENTLVAIRRECQEMANEFDCAVEIRSGERVVEVFYGPSDAHLR